MKDNLLGVCVLSSVEFFALLLGMLRCLLTTR